MIEFGAHQCLSCLTCNFYFVFQRFQASWCATRLRERDFTARLDQLALFCKQFWNRVIYGKWPFPRTLYESKGLEFNDVGCCIVCSEILYVLISKQPCDFQVVLYNFFHDSTLDVSQWRVILNAVDLGELVPKFDEMRHAPICSEVRALRDPWNFHH